jgi:hypothetical protein
VCPEPSCRQLALFASLDERNPYGGLMESREWRLLPPSRAKVYPEYIPTPIRSDYEEACLVEELSPKAAATLARRCMQGMIRDFWGVRRQRLVDEIDAIHEKVAEDIWQAIDVVRRVGNIGAHMEQDVNVIVDVDPGEAAKLIRLIELLMDEWYIARHRRQEQVTGVISMAAEKGIPARTEPSKPAKPG